MRVLIIRGYDSSASLEETIEVAGKNIKITMVHGNKDKSVPVNYSKRVLQIFKNAKKRLVIVKNGDHSLSSPKWLNLLKKELKLIIN